MEKKNKKGRQKELLGNPIIRIEPDGTVVHELKFRGQQKPELWYNKGEKESR